MEHVERITQAFSASPIRRILLVDDAYDPPDLDEDEIGDLADFLSSRDGTSACSECGIPSETCEEATIAAEEGNAEDEALKGVYQDLYAKFAQTGDPRFDPGKRFSLVKDLALAHLRPLHGLLQKCGDDIDVQTIGLNGAKDCFERFQPQVLFLDYYLSEDVPAAGDVTRYRMDKARKQSLELLKQLVATDDADRIPAIVLMSSRHVKNVGKYRHDAGGDHVLSLRFHFLNKRSVRQNGGEPLVCDDAADALLDTSQGYRFGRHVQQALAQWKQGAQQAFSEFLAEVAELHTKDFAYLLRFRLREEGQPVGTYLEWLFSECLKDHIEAKVNWQHGSFAALNDDTEAEAAIEGAFEGPSPIVAKLFHRVRVTNRERHAEMPYGLGDLYVQPRGQGGDIQAVISPDCDLVKRDGVAKAKTILTMVGSLEKFDKESSSADDFLIRDNRPYSVRWDPKHLRTFPFSGNGSLRASHATRQFLGTLRPLYAQEMQRRVLTDLSRVGLPVAPALGINVPFTVWIRLKTDFAPLELSTPTVATIIPRRREEDARTRILLRRRFIWELLSKLRDADATSMRSHDAKSLRKVLAPNGFDELREAYLRVAGELRGKRTLGIGFLAGNAPDRENNAPWLQIVLDLSDHAMEHIEAIDPLADSSE